MERQTRSRELRQSRWTNSLRLDVAAGTGVEGETAGRDGRIRKVQTQSKTRIFLKSQVTTVRGKTNWRLVARRTRLKYCKAGGWWAWYRTGVQVLGRRLERELVSHAQPQTDRARQTENMKGKGKRGPPKVVEQTESRSSQPQVQTKFPVLIKSHMKKNLCIIGGILISFFLTGAQYVSAASVLHGLCWTDANKVDLENKVLTWK